MLDAASEAAIARALAELKGTITILLIAHCGSLTARADQVITRDAAKIVAPADTVSDN